MNVVTYVLTCLCFNKTLFIKSGIRPEFANSYTVLFVLSDWTIPPPFEQAPNQLSGLGLDATSSERPSQSLILDQICCHDVIFYDHLGDHPFNANLPHFSISSEFY